MDNNRLQVSRRSVLLGTTAAGAVALAAACGDDGDPSPSGGGSAGPLTKFNFSLGWLPLGRYAPYYYAKSLGLYADRGLDVTLEPSNGTGTSMTQLLTGNIHATQAPMAALFHAMSSGVDPLVKGYANFWTRDLSTIFFFRGTISSPKELEGRTVTTSAGSNEFTKFPIFAAANGIDPNLVEWSNVDGSVKVGMLLRHETEFTSTTIYGLAQLESQKADDEEVDYFTYGDHGVGGIDGTVLMPSDWVAEHRDQAEAFIHASIEGYQAAFQDPQAAIDAMAGDVPTLDKDIAMRELVMLEDIVLGPAQQENGLGFIVDEQVEFNYDSVVEELGQPIELPYTDFFSNELLPGA